MCSSKMSLLILAFLALSFLDGQLPVARAQRGPIPKPTILPRPQVLPNPPTTWYPTPPPAYIFVVRNATFTKFCETRAILTVNSKYPGPEIRVHGGQTVYVLVVNNGAYGITIHWHGIKQPRNPWSDGPDMVTQCQIQPGQNFTYKVILSNEVGTIWWHAHSDWSRATVHGAFVVLPPPNKLLGSPFLFPQYTLVLATWYNQDLKEISDTIAKNGSATANATGYTLNGFPGDQVKCNNVSEPTYNMTVKRGGTYLLHVVNAAMHEPQYFGITAHNLTVIARDGSLVKSFSTPYILLLPGQSMDVLVEANQKPSRYYMRFRYFDDSLVDNTNTQNTTGFLMYDNAADNVNTAFPTLPDPKDNTTAFHFTLQLRSKDNIGAKVPRSHDVKLKRIIMTVRVDKVDCTGSSDCPAAGSKSAASLNRISFVAPTELDILKAYSEGRSDLYNTSYLFSPDEDEEGKTYAYQGTNVIELAYGDPVEIVFQAIDQMPAGGHPLHLHGYSFFQVGMNNGTFNNATDPAKYNLIDPPEMNTVTLFGSGWTAIRFFANNPGVWFMHCHFESHTTWGMATAFIVKDGPKADQKMLSAPKGLPTCGA